MYSEKTQITEGETKKSQDRALYIHKVRKIWYCQGSGVSGMCLLPLQTNVTLYCIYCPVRDPSRPTTRAKGRLLSQKRTQQAVEFFMEVLRTKAKDLTTNFLLLLYMFVLRPQFHRWFEIWGGQIMRQRKSSNKM